MRGAAFTLPAVLAVAGSDSSGGAGVQADLKTIAALGLYGESAITALTAQNTTGASAMAPVAPELVEAQVDAVFDDIAPQAVKVGMVGSAEVARAVARRLAARGASRVVVDPVMVATSGAALSGASAVEALVEALLPLATLVTPNIPRPRRSPACASGARPTSVPRCSPPPRQSRVSRPAPCS